MAFHSEIQINYQILRDIVVSLKKYDAALKSMQKSIAQMDLIISKNEGKTFNALRKVKHDFDGEIKTCREEISDIYGSIGNYISEMSGIIGASPAGSMLLVDRADIRMNMISIKNACEGIGQVGRIQRGPLIYPSSYKDTPELIDKLREDAERNAEMLAAIRASSKKIDAYYQEIDNIYDNKVVEFENTDDEHEGKINVLHDKYTNVLERLRENVGYVVGFSNGACKALVDLVSGVVYVAALPRLIEFYCAAKILGFEPPKWCKNAVEPLKEMTPWKLVEITCQGGSDSIAQKGWAYGSGYLITDTATMFAGTKGIDKVAKLGKAGKSAARLESTVSKGGKISNGPGRSIKSISGKFKPQRLSGLNMGELSNGVSRILKSVGDRIKAKELSHLKEAIPNRYIKSAYSKAKVQKLNHYKIVRPNRSVKSIHSKLKLPEIFHIKTRYMPKEVWDAVKKAGLTAYEFRRLILKDVAKLTPEERTILKQIRESIPKPDGTTKMQKVILIDDVDKYISGEYKIRNFVSRAEDGTFKDSIDAFDSLRLDYDVPGGQPKFTRGDSVVVIEYTSKESLNARIPYSPELGGDVVMKPPFTGNGFTKSANGNVVPEYFQPDINELKSGAKMYELNAKGEKIEIAEYIKGAWIRK